MTLFVFGISLLGMTAGVVLLILGLIKKKKLKGGIVLGVSILLFFVSLLMPAPEGSKEKVEVASKTQEELNKEKEATQAKKEEEKKALEDEKKAKEEKKAKIEDERKAKEAKQQAEEEAKLKEKQAAKEQASKEKTEKETEEKAKVSTENKSKPVTKEVVIETDKKEDIKKTVEKIVSADLIQTKISEILVNNYQAEDNKYIVLPHLKWDVKNGKKTTVEMLERYSDHIAAKLYEQPGIVEITVFWEVPYHLAGENIAKFNYTRTATGMAKNDNWLAPILK